MRRWLSLALVIVACDTSEPAREVAGASLEKEVASRLAGRPVVVAFEDDGDVALVGVRQPSSIDTDQPARYALHRYERSTGALLDLELTARAVRRMGSALLIVSEAGELERVDAAGRKRLASGVLGSPALLPGGRIVVAQRGSEPGESDLQLLGEGAPVPLAPAAGPDDFPIALPDGRVAFVSGRTGLASLWVVQPETGEARQLTNVGRDRVDDAFVPPPLRDVRVDAASLSYDAGDGARYRVDHRSGDVEREGAP